MAGHELTGRRRASLNQTRDVSAQEQYLLKEIWRKIKLTQYREQVFVFEDVKRFGLIGSHKCSSHVRLLGVGERVSGQGK